jgi:hypothetical protein
MYVSGTSRRKQQIDGDGTNGGGGVAMLNVDGVGVRQVRSGWLLPRQQPSGLRYSVFALI